MGMTDADRAQRGLDFFDRLAGHAVELLRSTDDGAPEGIIIDRDWNAEVVRLERENAQLRWMAGFEPGQALDGFGPDDPPRRYVLPEGDKRTNSCHVAFVAWRSTALDMIDANDAALDMIDANDVANAEETENDS